MEGTPQFEFTPVDATMQALTSPAAREALMQWNLDKSLQVHRFRFGGRLRASDYNRFVEDFMYSPQVRAAINATGDNPAQRKVTCRRLSTNVMRMDFFDRLQQAGIITGSGSIRGCMDETFDGMTVSCTLRELLINPESENAAVFSEQDRNEFLLHVFRLLVLGGPMCQADISIERYMQMTKDLYKELMTVYRNPKTNAVEVSSVVYQVSAVEGLQVFPRDNHHNRLFLVIDPTKHTVTMLYRPFVPFW